MIRRLFSHFKRNQLMQLDSRSAYAKWARNYPPTPHNLLMEIEQNMMLSMMPPLAGKRVLDLACGTGRYGLFAQEQKAKHVIGIDNSQHMLAQSPLLETVLGTMAKIPLSPASVDIIICGLAVGHYPKLDVIMSEIARILTPDGTALISDFHPFQYLSGARRTFSDGNQVYEVEHYPHLYETVHQSSKRVGLYIDAIRELTVDEGVMPIILAYRLKKSQIGATTD